MPIKTIAVLRKQQSRHIYFSLRFACVIKLRQIGKTFCMDMLFSTNIEDKEVLFEHIENTESVRNALKEDADEKTKIEASIKMCEEKYD